MLSLSIFFFDEANVEIKMVKMVKRRAAWFNIK